MDSHTFQFVGALAFAMAEAIGGDVLERTNSVLRDIVEDGAVDPIACGLIGEFINAAESA